MIPIRSEVKQVTPVAAEAERAVSELKENMRNEEPHMPLKKSIKKKFSKEKLICKPTAKENSRLLKKKKTEGDKKLKTLRKQLKKSVKAKEKTHRYKWPPGQPII